MSSGSHPLLPRPSADREHLGRLREKALARMKVDEDALLPAATGVVTRRWSLQRLGLLVAGLAPGVGALVRAQSALAEASASAGFRCPAPQYGAPPWPAPRVPYMPPVPVATLKSPDSWSGARANLIAAGKVWPMTVQIRTASYKPGPGREVDLNVISNPETKETFVIGGNNAFYVAEESGILGCGFSGSDLMIRESLFKMPTPSEGEGAVIEQFMASTNEKKLTKAMDSGREFRISLAEGVPPAFWTNFAVKPTQSVGGYVVGASLKDRVLSIYCRSWSNVDSGKGTTDAAFWIDLHRKKLLKTDIDGKEVK